MGRDTGFMEIGRQMAARRSVDDRVKDWFQVYKEPSDSLVQGQGERCMDCGIPFCHTGCPLGNIIPDWNDLVYRNRWKEAIKVLHKTNNFPEFTGWVCPAPCEAACVLGINDDPVTIKQIELRTIDHAFQEGWIKAEPPKVRTNKKVAIVGSGPSGLACAAQLNRAGHWVTVFERADRIGGLLTYGIPDFKMEKYHIDRRIAQMKSEGVSFKINVHVGKNFSETQLLKRFDAIVLACGSEEPRDLPVSGRNLDGVYFAMDFLTQQNKRMEGCKITDSDSILANGKHVVVIDDSLVRGTSSKAIIKALRRSGARKISMLITYPPIKFPCYAGIDFPSQEELATFTQGKEYSDNEIIEKVRNDIGADFLGYNDAENLANAVGIPLDSMCFTCTSGNYEPLGIKPEFKTREQLKGD